MSKIICAACDCKWNDVNNRCRAKEVHLEDNYIMTIYDGRQHFNRCQNYETSETMKSIMKEFERMITE